MAKAGYYFLLFLIQLDRDLCSIQANTQPRESGKSKRHCWPSADSTSQTLQLASTSFSGYHF